MDQIRIFTNFDVSSLEAEVNEWLRENKNKIISIKSNMVSKGSHPGSVTDMMERTIVIHYEAKVDD